MHIAFKNIFSSLLDLVALPRPTEVLMRSLTLEHLEAVANRDGTLPYHSTAVRALIWELKYRANPAAAGLAGAYLSELILAEASERIGTPLLLPMPMHAARRRERGYNQTELLCEAVLKTLSGFNYDPNILIRTVNTVPQQGLARHKRLKNVKNSMRIADSKKIKGRICIVVDDVTTTGASFAEARRALMSAGAHEVVCIALAQS